MIYTVSLNMLNILGLYSFKAVINVIINAKSMFKYCLPARPVAIVELFDAKHNLLILLIQLTNLCMVVTFVVSSHESFLNLFLTM